MTNDDDFTYEPLDLDPVDMLKKSVKEVAASLDIEAAAAIVKVYYGHQQNRISLANQFKASTLSKRPDAPVLDFLATQAERMERHMKAILGEWALASPEGEWAQAQKGVGPVLSAGLRAHIDVNIAKTAGSVWRFAGLDSTLEWHGAKGARELVAAAWEVENSAVSALWWLSQATHRRMENFLEAISIAAEDDNIKPAHRGLAERAVANLSGASLSTVRSLFEERPLHIDNAITYACEELDVRPIHVYEELYGPIERGIISNKDAVTKMLAKRPYNADLKVICWRLGDSFVKVQNRENAYYGELYKMRKQQEVQKNNNRDFADQAAESLRKRNIKDKLLKRTYEDGRLPDGRIDLRARRYAVKLFLAHYFEVAYEAHFGQKPPIPYPIAHLGHTKRIAPPPGAIA